jgi:hypothetical protein
MPRNTRLSGADARAQYLLRKLRVQRESSPAETTEVVDPWTAELPRTLFTAPYVSRTGTVRTVNSGENLQTVLDAAQPGDVVVLEAGAVWTGNFTLPSKSGSTNDIYVVSSTIHNGSFGTAPGRRVQSNAGMAYIRHPNGNVLPALATSGSGRTGWRICGVQVDLSTGTWSYGGDTQLYDLVKFCPDYSNPPQNINDYPGRFVMDRCRIIGRRDVSIRRGVTFGGPDGGIFDSQMFDVNSILPVGDCVGIICWLAAGNIHIYNTEIEGPTEHVMPGGVLDNNWTADTQIVPYDITVDRCYLRGGLYQDESEVGTGWNGVIYNTKNFLETKAGKRIRFRRILMSRHLGKDQQFALTIKSNGEVGGGLGSGSVHPTFDINIEDLKILNAIGGIQIRGLGTDLNRLERVRIRNVGMAGHRIPTGGYTVNPRVLQFTSNMRYIDVSNLTGLLTLEGEYAKMLVEDNSTIENIRITDSILGAKYGIGYGGSPWGGLPPNVSGEKLLRRLGLIQPGSTTTYGDASNVRVGSVAAAQFVSYTNSVNDNLRLQSSSPLKGIGAGGADPGCDWDSLDAETAGCISGVWS